MHSQPLCRLARVVQKAPSSPPRMIMRHSTRCTRGPAVAVKAAAPSAVFQAKPCRGNWGAQQQARISNSTMAITASRLLSSQRACYTVAASRSRPVDDPGFISYEDIVICPLEKDMLMPPKERLFWNEKLSRLRRRTAIDAVRQLEMAWRMGMSPYFGKFKRKPNAWDTMMLGKTRRPYAIILVKVGSFYEAAGMDAVLLVEHCGLNFMGGNLSAGCPVGNIHQVLKQLVREAGFDVAVWEEVGELSGGRKNRAEMQLVTPENPHYWFNYAEATSDVEVDAPPICGLSVSTRGFDVYVYSYSANSIQVYKGLNPDAVWGITNADMSSSPVLYQHRMLETPSRVIKSHTSRAQLDALHIKEQLSSKGVVWKVYEAADPVQGFIQQLLKSRNLPPDTLIEADVGAHGTRPLYLSTAMELGLIPWMRSVPPLANFLLPETSVKVVRDTMASLLTAPPPFAVAASLREAVRLLMSLDEPLPVFLPGVTTPKKVLLVLGSKEANARFFQDLKAGLEPVAAALSPGRSEVLAALVNQVWPLLMHTTDSTGGQSSTPHTALSQDKVLAAAQEAVKAVRVLVAQPSSPGRSSSPTGSQEAAGGSEDEVDVPKQRGGRRRVEKPLDREYAKEEANRAFDELGKAVELWAQRVSVDAIKQDLGPFFDHGEYYVAVLTALLEAVIKKLSERLTLTTSNRPQLVVDTMNSAVWLKLPSEAMRKCLRGVQLDVKYDDTWRPVNSPNQVLRSPGERKGKGKASDVFTCDELESALYHYLDAVEDANAAATAALRRLADDLSQHKVQLAAAMQLGILLSTLWDHSRAACKAGWHVPLVGSREQQEAAANRADSSSSDDAGIDSSNPDSSSSSSDASLMISGDSTPHPAHDGVFKLSQLWPYWMSGSDPSTVKNDVDMAGFMLLTGPNMAGKSTVLRSIAAAALAGSVGLAIPAAAGSQLPLLDAVMLRTFSGDAPQEGQSAFAVEMREMGTVLADVRPSSLVLVDELGKGTEVISGTALAASMLRQLAASGAMGVFATHLHLLVDRLKGVQRLDFYKMEVVRPDTSSTTPAAAGDMAAEYDYLYNLQPTWKLLPGTCFESLAFAVAQECGLPPAVLEEAQREYHHIMHSSHSLRGYESIMQVVRAGKSTNSSASSSMSSTDDAGSVQDVQDELLGLSAADAASDLPTVAAVMTHPLDDCQEQQEVASSELQGDANTYHSQRLRKLQEAADSSSSGGGGTDLVASREQVHALFNQFMDALAPSAAAEPEPARRRRRKPSGEEQQQQQSVSPSSQASPAAQSVPGEGGVQLGRVHELCVGAAPPLHEGKPVVYVLRNEGGWFYIGESQEVGRRLQQHRRTHGRELVMWYVLVSPSADRKVLQGRMISTAQQLGWPMWSSRDASMARRK